MYYLIPKDEWIVLHIDSVFQHNETQFWETKYLVYIRLEDAVWEPPYFLIKFVGNQGSRAPKGEVPQGYEQTKFNVIFLVHRLL